MFDSFGRVAGVELMPFYTIPFKDIATGAVADTFKTIAALELGDAQENRYRLRKLVVGPSDAAPGDVNVSLSIKRINDVSAGGVGTAGTTITAANLPCVDNECTPAVGLEANINYSAEPTTYETHELWHAGMNGRGALIENWAPEEAPVVKRDQLLGLLAAPQGAAAFTMSGCMLVESF
jgi:hypothetical protein